MFDAIIIGGGASGVMCAIIAAKRNKKILIIDEGSSLAKKLLVTGNGKCNLTNVKINENSYNQDITAYLKRFNINQTLNLFSNMGLLYYTDNEGRVYPYSNSAKSVVEVLNNECAKLNINTKLNTRVLKISKNDNYVVETNNGVFRSKQLVVAFGTKNSQNLLTDLNIGYCPFVPSLTALMTENTKKLSGIRLSNVEITAKCKNKVFTERGELLYKDSGISGIVIFNTSSLFARNNCFKGEVLVNLMPDYSREQIKDIIAKRLQNHTYLCNVFEGWFMEQVALEICKKANIDAKTLIQKLTKKDIEKLVDTIVALKYEVNGCYENNQVFAGGVKLTELTENLESKKHAGLFFCGEVCDVDGVCGGYNLQWAWTSGHIVGESL